LRRSSLARRPTAKPKKKTVRAVRRGSARMPLMPTKITWEGAKYYTHYEVESKEWLSVIKDYIKKNYDKKTLSAINKLPDWKVGGKSHWTCTAYLLEHNPDLVPESYSTGFKKWIDELAEEGAKVVEEKKAEEKTKKNVYVPSIQERISEQAQLACEEVEEWLDGFVTDKKKFDPKGFNFTKHFTKMKVTQAHARKIKKYYTDELEEAQLIQKLPTPGEINRCKNEHEADMLRQLREGYSHLTKKDAKAYLEALELLHGACDVVIDAAKANRKPRKKVAPSKDKLVAKVKYCERDDKLQLVSVNPLDLLQASEAWVYNVKTRKLGKYVASNIDPKGTLREGSGLSVKGTTIIGYDEEQSIQKTLRKPDETLKEFKKAGKVALRKFLDNIKTTDIKLNGRLNSDTIILKCVK
jgi:hypothetical protein